MIVAVKKAIFQLFGPDKYLKILHTVFRMAYTMGFLKTMKNTSTIILYKN